MRVLLGIGIAIVVAVVAALVAIASGGYDVAADKPHGEAVGRLLETLRRQSVRVHAKTVEAPPPADPAMVEAGAKRYDQACEGCHGAAGIEGSASFKGLYPPPTDLSKTVHEWNPQELFWITKHGLKFTGMPAYAQTLVDGELWEVVAFLGQLPGMPPERYQELVQPPAPTPAPEGEAQPPAAAPPEAVIPPSEGSESPGITLPVPQQPMPQQPMPQQPMPQQPMPQQPEPNRP
jgi:mono/diheme cytochrome c family protein